MEDDLVTLIERILKLRLGASHTDQHRIDLAIRIFVFNDFNKPMAFMNKIKFTTPLLLLLIFSSRSSARQLSRPLKEWVTVSPDKSLRMIVRQLSGSLSYSVVQDNDTVIRWSPLGITRGDADFRNGLQFEGVQSRKIDNWYTMLSGLRRLNHDLAGETVLSFHHSAGESLKLIIRAYNNGAAFRYAFPSGPGKFSIESETTGFPIPPVLFETGMLHLAERAESYRDADEKVRALMHAVPVAWDDTKFLQGEPGKLLVLARRKVDQWFVAGANGEGSGKNVSPDLSFLPKGNHSILILSDGEDDRTIHTEERLLTDGQPLDIPVWPQGGFIIWLKK